MELLILAVVLVVVLGLIVWRGRPVIIQGLDGRIAAIRASLDEAQDLLTEAQERLGRAQTTYDQLDDQIDAETAAARKDMRSYKTRAKEDIKQAIKRREALTKDLIEGERTRAIAEIRQEVADHLIKAAQRWLAEQDATPMTREALTRALAVREGAADSGAR